MIHRAPTLLSLSLLLACDPPIGSIDAGAEAGHDAGHSDVGEGTDAPSPATWRFEVIETREVPVGPVFLTAELVRAHRPDGARTYLLYFHAPTDEAPLVIYQSPYDGIDWTGEELDARWAALGDGLHPDVEAPAYDGDDLVGYTRKTVEAAASDGYVFLYNGFAVVFAYGRFYAGGSIEDDILDATAPYHFALSRDAELDLDRLASVGGSWGGMMAVFGASRAPSGLTLRSLVPLTPLSDFVDAWTWIAERGPAVYPDLPAFDAFFSPYRRRIEAATRTVPPDESPAAWARYGTAAVCAGLRALDPGVAVLMPHDEWDQLIPVAETRALAAACPELVQPLYWPRDGEIPYGEIPFDHGPFSTEEAGTPEAPGLPVMLTLGYLHIALALTAAPQTALTAAVPASLDSYLSLLRAAQERGEDVSYAAAPLALLCDPRATYFDGVTMTIEPGADLISGALNRVYEVTTTPDDVCAELADGLPEPP